VIGGRALLVERLLVRAIDETLEYDGPVANGCERARRYRHVVLHQLELGHLGLLGKIELGGIGDADFLSFNGEDLGGLGFAHKIRVHCTP